LIPYIVIEQLYLVFLFEYQFILLSWISQEYTTSGIRTIDVNQFCIKGPVVFAIFCSIIGELAHPNSSLANAYLSAYLWSHVPCLVYIWHSVFDESRVRNLDFCVTFYGLKPWIPIGAGLALKGLSIYR